ncbi:MAG: hypothetical protein AB3N11_12210 [Arenibacterium sp.]
MGDPFLIDAARAVHLIGLAVGFGLAICADVLAAKSVFAPIARRDVDLLQLLHRAILAGLVLLWSSGLVLLYVRTGFDLAAFSPKLAFKLGVVLLLTANAFVIGRFALPVYRANAGRRFGEITLTTRMRLASIAAVSASCWLSAMALGVFSQLKPLGVEALQSLFAPLFLFGLLGAVALVFGTGLAALSARRSGENWPRAGVSNRVTTRALHL